MAKIRYARNAKLLAGGGDQGKARDVTELSMCCTMFSHPLYNRLRGISSPHRLGPSQKFRTSKCCDYGRQIATVHDGAVLNSQGNDF